VAGIPLAAFLGADKDRIVCGVSIGITETTDELRRLVDGYLADGYRRIKLKIEPGIDVGAWRRPADHPGSCSP
jgi:O-succinylbenzoate synthase